MQASSHLKHVLQQQTNTWTVNSRLHAFTGTAVGTKQAVGSINKDTLTAAMAVAVVCANTGTTSQKLVCEEAWAMACTGERAVSKGGSTCLHYNKHKHHGKPAAVPRSACHCCFTCWSAAPKQVCRRRIVQADPHTQSSSGLNIQPSRDTCGSHYKEVRCVKQPPKAIDLPQQKHWRWQR